jgi:hypothetical protein
LQKSLFGGIVCLSQPVKNIAQLYVIHDLSINFRTNVENLSEFSYIFSYIFEICTKNLSDFVLICSDLSVFVQFEDALNLNK